MVAPSHPGRRPAPGHGGYTVIELLFALGVALAMAAAVVPQTLVAVDLYRLHGAVRYVSSRLQHARVEAVVRSANVGVRFQTSGSGYTMTTYVDVDGDGVRTADILNGVDRPVRPPERLTDLFRGVDFGLQPALPAVVAGGVPPSGDPIKLGSGDILSFTPFGSATSGSLYLAGTGATQAVLRVYGVTGKVRALVFDRTTESWNPF